jgi:CRP-like cAMP-binding protein
MTNDGMGASALAARGSAGLRRALRQLPEGGVERQAVDAGEIDAIIDHGNANVIMFPLARRALRDAAIHATAAPRPAAVESLAANSVLAALPRAECERLLPNLEPVMLGLGDVLHEPSAPVRFVYFPIDCTVCLLTKTEGQRAVATGMVGYEGIVGTSLVFGVDVSPVRALVIASGKALRMPAWQFDQELRCCPSLQRELHRYAYGELAQARQAVVCIDSHRLEQRLACWLLMISDRSMSPELTLTQERLAVNLNVRRVSVTLACASLRTRKLISCKRSKIKIISRNGLEGACCSCYTKIEAVHAA